MNISKIDGSRYGAVLFGQPSPAASAITRSRAVRVHNGCAKSITNDLHTVSRHACPTRPQWAHGRHPNLSLPRTFCAAVTPGGGRFSNSNYFTSSPATLRSWNHTAVPSTKPTEETKGPNNPGLVERRAVGQPKDEVLAIVDYYDDDVSVEESLKFYRDPYLRKYASANGPDIVVSDKPEDLELQTVDGDPAPAEEDSELAKELRLAIIARHRHPGKVSLDTIWDLYHALPEPRPMQISARTRYSLTNALASGERKNEKSMLRYFSVIADIKNAGFSLTTFQWNSALSFATRYVARTTEVEVEAALKLWREMEMEAKLKGNEVTFNILFDAASKAGKFNLAEMIYKEMTHRGFACNRYHHVSLIHYFGLKQDSSGVRAGYREMIEAGEIVDTVVLNCLIASFIRCGEEQSAEHVYEKMKTFNKHLPTLPHRDYTIGKAITKVLAMFARVGKKHPSMRPAFQKSALLSPDLQTYRILINHYGLRLGNLSKVAQFLDEMKAFMVPLNGMVFLALFQSFSIHGGSGSDWSAQRLDSVWDAFLDAMDSGADGLYISTWLAMAVLEAHARYASREELLDVYECLRSRWELDDANSQYMLHFLETLLKEGGMYVFKSRLAAMHLG
ncbi:hypothetical protein GQX73_g6411 [Xylaria multiplex]|uniref:Pentacotripeptide-repeat region of PRORP domain-containing protein n=1 Tax=Xylaria multiplex TaxID=323545 RepID=A0A7C8IQH7_9PEZI|nr:hypothetical protein GQX73_g6411 [Xylaria multiplex]